MGMLFWSCLSLARNLISLVGGSTGSALVVGGVSSFTSIDSVGVRSQSGESWSMG